MPGSPVEYILERTHLEDLLHGVGRTKAGDVGHSEVFQSGFASLPLHEWGPVVSWSPDTDFQLFEAPDLSDEGFLDGLTMTPQGADCLLRAWGPPGARGAAGDPELFHPSTNDKHYWRECAEVRARI